MNTFVKYVVKLLVGYLKRIWYYIKLNRLFEELETEKKEAGDAVKNAEFDYDEFSRMYAEYLDGRAEQKSSHRTSELRRSVGEVREDGGESKESD